MMLTPDFDKNSLLPAVVQDADSGQVLMLAYMNEEAYRLTIETRQTHFWSRSRQTLWHKGAESGNVQPVVEIRLDCDRDAILLKVKPDGPACHTGAVSCFFQEPFVPAFSLQNLYELICQRRDNPSPGSYTASLFEHGEDEIAKKLGEEAIEVILASKGQGNQRLVEELADLTYHALVLLAQNGLQPADIRAELARRHK
jgi:phosphoribosyl-AMP cyclohydrolase / phosphoribosyl-ATP pyrophosphohydrolase